MIFKENIELSDDGINILNNFFINKESLLSTQKHHPHKFDDNYIEMFNFSIPNQSKEFNLFAQQINKIFKINFQNFYHSQHVSFERSLSKDIEDISESFGTYYNEEKYISLKKLMLGIFKANLPSEYEKKLIDEKDINSKKTFGASLEINQVGISQLKKTSKDPQ